MAGGYFTDVVLHSSKNYHQERATELRQLSKDVRCGFTFPWSLPSVQAVICGIGELEQRKYEFVGLESVIMWAGGMICAGGLHDS
jgi:hypothetical protein